MDTNTTVIATPPQLGHYTIDPGQSAVTFRTRHLFGLGPVRGTFDIRAGRADIADPIATSAIYAEIETGSFRTNSSQRDATVLSRRFLDAARYPMMIFRSDQFDPDRQLLTGTLTVQDTARPISLTVTRCDVAQGSFTASATTRVDRTEFGIAASPGLAGRYLNLTVDVRCVRS